MPSAVFLLQRRATTGASRVERRAKKKKRKLLREHCVVILYSWSRGCYSRVATIASVAKVATARAGASLASELPEDSDGAVSMGADRNGKDDFSLSSLGSIRCSIPVFPSPGLLFRVQNG